MRSLRSSTNKTTQTLFPHSSCWIIVDECHAALESQSLGLSEVLGLVPTLKKVRPHFPYNIFPKFLWFSPLNAATCSNASLSPPWPKIIIAAGPTSTALAQEIKAKFGCFTISIGQPAKGVRNFDVIIPFPSESLRGSNIIPALGHMHRITESSLLEGKRRYARQFEFMSKPRFMVYLDGTHPSYGLPKKTLLDLLTDLKSLHERLGCSYFIHIGEHGENFETLLGTEMTNVPHLILKKGPNPAYLGQLAMTDVFIATNDAMHFMSEAATCGKPIFTYKVPGHDAGVYNFNRAMGKQGYCFHFDLENICSSLLKRNLTLKPFFEPQQIAEQIWAIYHANNENGV